MMPSQSSTRWLPVDPAAWPVGSPVEFYTDWKGNGDGTFRDGVIVGHTAQTIRILPDGARSPCNRAQYNVRIKDV